jgi:hypothetical protein
MEKTTKNNPSPLTYILLKQIKTKEETKDMKYYFDGAK